MPECAACGNHVPADQRCDVGGADAAPGDDTIDECPHRHAGGTSQSRRATPVGPGTPDAGNGNGASTPAVSLEPGDDEPAAEESAEPEFTVKTAGRSLEWPRESPGADRSPADRSHQQPAPIGRTDGSRHSRDRFQSALTSVLDVFR